MMGKRGIVASAELIASPKKLERLMPSSDGVPVGAGEQAFRQIHIDPFRRIRRIDADHEISHEVAALGQRDRFDRRRLGKRPVVLGQRVDRLRQRIFRPLDGFLLRSAAGDAAGEIGKPGAECPLGTALQNRRKERVFSSGLAGLLCYFTHCDVSNNTSFRCSARIAKCLCVLIWIKFSSACAAFRSRIQIPVCGSTLDLEKL